MTGVLVGLDLEDVERWRSPVRRITEHFTAAELQRAASMADPAPHYAGWWCAREAVYKALNPVLPELGFRDISLEHDEHGPTVLIAGHPEWAAATQVSITHTALTAAAVALCLVPRP